MKDSSPPLLVALPEARADRDFHRIGAKAQSLVNIQKSGLLTPPAFFITREAFLRWESGEISEQFWDGVEEMWSFLAAEYTAIYPDRPLVVSVRSSGPRSMPGIMDTLLYVGLTTDSIVRFRVAREQSAVTGIHEHLLAERVRTFEDWQTLDEFGQLRRAITACWASATTALAAQYRDHHSLGSADTWAGVVVQGMVFGALGTGSGSGVVFSRNPISGEPRLFGEWVPRQDGTLLVGGIRTPVGLEQFATEFPALNAELVRGVATLERARRDAQEVEFTVEEGRLWFLQTKDAKRTLEADRVIIADLHREGLITEEELKTRSDLATHTEVPSIPTAISASPGGDVIAVGLPAAPGTGAGLAVNDVGQALQLHDSGAKVILVRETTSPADLPGMLIAEAIVTARGGATSHAAVLARELGKPCVVGCGDNTVARLTGRYLEVDGATGNVYESTHPA